MPPPGAGDVARGGPGARIRRFYWELVAGRRDGLVPALALSDARLTPALGALREASDAHAVRIACVVELPAADADGAADVVHMVRHLLTARDALARHDIALDLWPQLRTAPGTRGARFLNTSTASTFQQRLLPLLDALGRCGDGKHIGIALDIEPSEELVRSAWSVRNAKTSLWCRARAVGGLVQGIGRALVDARQGRRDLTELARDLAARGVPLHAAVLPPLASGQRSDAWRTWTLGIPVVDADGEPLFGTQAAMCYAPLAQRMPSFGRSGRATWSRETEKRTLALWAARHRATFDAVVVGQTSTGILGDEPIYQDARVFAEDVRAMEALDYADVGVYALEGIFFGPHGVPGALRRDVDAWIGAAFGRTTRH
jgi:hypothetical protein